MILKRMVSYLVLIEVCIRWCIGCGTALKGDFLRETHLWEHFGQTDNIALIACSGNLPFVQVQSGNKSIITFLCICICYEIIYKHPVLSLYGYGKILTEGISLIFWREIPPLSFEPWRSQPLKLRVLKDLKAHFWSLKSHSWGLKGVYLKEIRSVPEKSELILTACKLGAL